jgi:hypothetical protein
MLLVELYLLFNRRLPAYSDLVIVALLAVLVGIYVLVTLRLLVLGIVKVCVNLRHWLNEKKGRSIYNQSSVKSIKNNRLIRFAKY